MNKKILKLVTEEKKLTNKLRKQMRESGSAEIRKMASSVPAAIKIFEYMFKLYDAIEKVPTLKGIVPTNIEITGTGDKVSDDLLCVDFMLKAVENIIKEA